MGTVSDVDDLLQSLISTGSADTRPLNPQEDYNNDDDNMDVNIIPGSSENVPDQAETGTDVDNIPLPLINKCSIIFFEDKEVDGGEDDNDFALNDGDGDNDDYDLYGNNNNMFAYQHCE